MLYLCLVVYLILQLFKVYSQQESTNIPINIELFWTKIFTGYKRFRFSQWLSSTFEKLPSDRISEGGLHRKLAPTGIRSCSNQAPNVVGYEEGRHLEQKFRQSNNQI